MSNNLLRKDLQNLNIKTPILSSELYEKFRLLVEVGLPGLAALYVGLAVFWDLPKPTEVAGSISALALFLGLFIKADRNRNNKVEAVKAEIAEQKKIDGQVGELVLGGGDDKEGYVTLRLDKEPAELAGQDEIRLNVLNLGLEPKE